MYVYVCLYLQFKFRHSRYARLEVTEKTEQTSQANSPFNRDRLQVRFGRDKESESERENDHGVGKAVSVVALLASSIAIVCVLKLIQIYVR